MKETWKTEAEREDTATADAQTLTDDDAPSEAGPLTAEIPVPLTAL